MISHLSKICSDFFFFKTGSRYVVWTGLELAMQARLASNSQRSACLCLPSVRIKGTYHYVQLSIFFYIILFLDIVFPLLKKQTLSSPSFNYSNNYTVYIMRYTSSYPVDMFPKKLHKTAILNLVTKNVFKLLF